MRAGLIAAVVLPVLSAAGLEGCGQGPEDQSPNLATNDTSSTPAAPAPASEPPAAAGLTKAALRESAVGLTKAELRERFGPPDVAGEYDPGREYWTYWPAHLKVLDPDSGVPATQVIFKFAPDGSVYEIKF